MHPILLKTPACARAFAWQSIVLHKLTLASQSNDFPLALGAKITGVDDKTFSSTGESYSTIKLANSTSHTAKSLQEDDVSLAYEFVSRARHAQMPLGCLV